MADATFLYDFNSPYAYLAARRVDEVLGGNVRWQPIAFGALLVQTGRVPWSFTDERPAGMAECERRARERGLPAFRWPPGWPKDSYSLLPLRAALVGQSRQRVGAAPAVVEAARARDRGAGLLDRGHDLARADAAVAARAGGEVVGDDPADLAGAHRVGEPRDTDLALAAREAAER